MAAGMLKTDIADGIATITIDQEGRRMNVLSLAFSEALDAEIARLAADDAVTGIILTSGKPGFVAGADLAEVAELLADPEAAARELTRFGPQIRRMESCGKPVVAALTGTALGGGLELALGCHYRIAADDADARYGLPEVGLGLLPGAGGTQRLPRILGLERAIPMLTGGKPVSAAEGKAIGLFDEVVAADSLLSAARRALSEGRVPAQQPWDARAYRPPGQPVGSIEAFTGFLMANASAAADAGHYQPAAAAILSAVFEGIRLPIDRALQAEARIFSQLIASHAARGLVEARFLLRQRTGKRGVRKADPADAAQAGMAAAVTQAMKAEAAQIAAEGTPVNVIRNAATRAGLPPLLDAGPVAGDAPIGAETLDSIATRLLDAGANALAGAADQDLATLAAIDLAGYPEWTGGPAFWRKIRAETP